MFHAAEPVVLIDGREPTVTDLIYPAVVNFGHFTAMQVRRSRVRGLDRHLRRLRGAHIELFGREVDPDWVRECMRRAVAGRADCYLRVTLFESEPGHCQVMTVVRAPVDPPRSAQSLRTVEYVRPFPSLKHVGTFAQIQYGLMAERDGFDDALLVDAEGRISETTIGNIGFLKGDRVVWPDGPALVGITRQLLDDILHRAGSPSTTQMVTVTDLASFDAAFVTNSTGIAPITHIGVHRYECPLQACAPVAAHYEAISWDPI